MIDRARLGSYTRGTLVPQSVSIEGRLDGMLLSTTLRQSYRNETGQRLEVYHTFDLAWGATLLGMDAEVAGKRLHGVVVEREETERKCEEAVDKDVIPIMVKQSERGEFTAELGKIKNKESVDIEIRCVQLLRFEQGCIRIEIPTYIAPHYGDAQQEDYLTLHEEDAMDLSARRYPLTVHLKILGKTAEARITSPSHNVIVNSVENGVSVLLEPGAGPARDFILLLEGLEGHSFALSAPDGEQHVTLASFCPSLPGQEASPLLLKILVDCSGSMDRAGFREAKIALGRVIQELKTGDYLSCSRFGSWLRHENTCMESCSGNVLQRYTGVVAETDADMGEADMEQALLRTFKNVALPDDTPYRPNVLLISDAGVCDSEVILRACVESGHRIFAVGVGNAPAESLLRGMAEKTGGACEFVSPNEDVSAAVMRIFRRMRTGQSNNMRIAWGCEPVRQTPLPQSVFDGDTIHLFAVFDKSPDTLPELTWDVDGHTHRAMPVAIGRTDDPDPARSAGAAFMETATTKEESLALALKYQLVNKQTALFLVYLRDSEDKATKHMQLPHIFQIWAAATHWYDKPKTSIFFDPILTNHIPYDADSTVIYTKEEQRATIDFAFYHDPDEYIEPDKIEFYIETYTYECINTSNQLAVTEEEFNRYLEDIALEKFNTSLLGLIKEYPYNGYFVKDACIEFQKIYADVYALCKKIIIEDEKVKCKRYTHKKFYSLLKLDMKIDDYQKIIEHLQFTGKGLIKYLDDICMDKFGCFFNEIAHQYNLRDYATANPENKYLIIYQCLRIAILCLKKYDNGEYNVDILKGNIKLILIYIDFYRYYIDWYFDSNRTYDEYDKLLDYIAQESYGCSIQELQIEYPFEYNMPFIIFEDKVIYQKQLAKIYALCQRSWKDKI